MPQYFSISDGAQLHNAATSYQVFAVAHCPNIVCSVGSLAESPECWNLEFQPVEIFADNFLIFADKFHIFASNLSSMLINI